MSSFVLSTVISIGIGVFSAMYPNSLWDRALTVLSFIGVSIPVFFFGLLLIKVFGYDLAVLPFSGIETMGKNYQGIDRALDIGRHMILPGDCLGSYPDSHPASVYPILHSVHCIGGLHENSSGQGAHEKAGDFKTWNEKCQSVYYHGALQPPSRPVKRSADCGDDFCVAGIGQLNYQAILVRDYPLIMGIALLLAVIVIGCNLLADVLCMILDPRVRNSVGV